ncbi:MAG: hypothetical protein IPP58_05225 [Holophagaceae bacterium]|uniref:Uncharacterized protein n=1 Tax=Candidatus Geothrix skivensis TaxID=2954439 RepID=A0A9D7SFR8_9BACT|nr:hypothetical protein [Candidatus Geothrix skivensis]
MKFTPLIFTPALILSLAAAPASKGEFLLLRQEIVAARKALVDMVLYREKRGTEQQALVKASADKVSATLVKLQAPAGKVAEFNELRSTWSAFKQTREKELVPAILAGERDRYDKLAAGIQKERLDRLYSLISALEQ